MNKFRFFVLINLENAKYTKLSVNFRPLQHRHAKFFNNKFLQKPVVTLTQFFLNYIKVEVNFTIGTTFLLILCQGD